MKSDDASQDNFGFRSVFWTTGVVAALAALMMIFLVPESTADLKEKMDWVGVLPLVVAVGAALIALNELGTLADADRVLVIGLFAVAAAAFLAFWRVENRSGHPLVATELLRRRSTWALLLNTVLTMTGVFAVMNGLVPALARDATVGFGTSAGEPAWWTLTPYALAWLAVGPLSGRLAATHGYLKVLRIGMIGSVVSLGVMLLVVGSDSRLLLLRAFVLIGLTYAGTGNIILDGLGIVLSPKESPGFLPGLDTGAFNLGAGLSLAVILAAKTALSPADGSGTAGYHGALVAGLLILAVAFATSFLIPRPEGAEAAAPAVPVPVGH